MDHYSVRLQSITERQNGILKKIKQSGLPRHLERYTQKLRLEYLKSCGEDISLIEKKMEKDWDTSLKLAKKYRDDLRVSDDDDDDDDASDYYDEDYEKKRRAARRKTTKKDTRAKLSTLITVNPPEQINTKQKESSSASLKKSIVDQSKLY